MIDLRKSRRILAIALATSAVLQFPFLLMILTGPHYGGSIGVTFFSPGFYVMDHLPPPLDLKFSYPKDSEFAVLTEMFLIQVALLGGVLFPLVVVSDSLIAKLSDGVRRVLFEAVVSSAVAVLTSPFLLVFMVVMGPNHVLFQPSLYLVNHIPPPLNFGPEGPNHNTFGGFVEFFVFQVFLSAAVLFALVVSFRCLGTSLLHQSANTRRRISR